MDKVILKAAEIDGYLTDGDKENLEALDKLFAKALDIFSSVQSGKKDAEGNLIKIYNEMGDFLQEICQKTPQIHVYSFNSPQEDHSEASRVIAKLRDINTNNREFLYYIQRAYEMLFKLAW